MTDFDNLPVNQFGRVSARTRIIALLLQKGYFPQLDHVWLREYAKKSYVCPGLAGLSLPGVGKHGFVGHSIDQVELVIQGLPDLTIIKSDDAMILYEYKGYRRGDQVVSTLAKPPATPRFIKFFIRFENSVRVYFDTTKDADSVKNSAVPINDWEYGEGLLKKVG